MASAKTKMRGIPDFSRALPWLMVVGGLIGLFSSAMLVYDQVKIWQNPGYLPSCNLNPIINCGQVINAHQGDLFGMPAQFFGVVAFPALITIGVALLAGAKFKRWFWLGLQAGAVFGLGFALWLFFVSMYRIQALCPFCLTVDVVVYTIFWYITLHNLQAGHLKIKAGWQKGVNFAMRHHLDILVLWLVLSAAYIVKHFWYYYGQFFS